MASLTKLSRFFLARLSFGRCFLGRLCMAGYFFSMLADGAPPCPNLPLTADISSAQVPGDVCIPNGFVGNPIAFFDDYSWKSFVSLMWPALQGQRGAPDSAKKIGDLGQPLVFETFKADWELFQRFPTAWTDFGAPNPCAPANVGFTDMVLASFSKFGNLGEGDFGQLAHALPAQNHTWVRYATAFNETEYNEIIQKKLYLTDGLTAAIKAAEMPGSEGLQLPKNSMDIKSSWIDMTGIQHPETYHTRLALVMDPVSKTCNVKTVGLVGLHIVQKTDSRPQWIWSTFEHVNNVPPNNEKIGVGVLPIGELPSYTFNDGKLAGLTFASDPNGGFPPKNWSKPVVYDVSRELPISASTQTTNAAYQQALGGVWRNYQLVMTQWPLQEKPPAAIPKNQDGEPTNTFPGDNSNTSFANTTLETWEQKTVTCMQCHTVTQTDTDFVWSLKMNAVTPLKFGVVQKPQLKIEAEKQLKAILQKAHEHGR